MQRLSIHSDSKALSGQIIEKIASIPKYEYGRKAFNKGLERMKYCIKYKEHSYGFNFKKW